MLLVLLLIGLSASNAMIKTRPSYQKYKFREFPIFSNSRFSTGHLIENLEPSSFTAVSYISGRTDFPIITLAASVLNHSWSKINMNELIYTRSSLLWRCYCMPSSLIHDSPLNWICKRPIRVNTHACYYLLLCSTSVLFVSIHTPTKTWECSGIQLRIPYATLHRENIKIDSLKNFPPKLPRHLYTLIISNCKFEIINVTQIAFRITSSLSFWHSIETLSHSI